MPVTARIDQKSIDIASDEMFFLIDKQTALKDTIVIKNETKEEIVVPIDKSF